MITRFVEDDHRNFACLVALPTGYALNTSRT